MKYKYRFKTSKGYLKSYPPVAYTADAKDAMVSALDTGSITDDEIQEDFMDIILAMSEDLGAIDLVIEIYNETDTDLIANINIDAHHVSLDSTDVATPEDIAELKEITKELVSYMPSLKVMLSMALATKGKATSKGLADDLASALGIPKDKSIGADSSEDEIIDYINNKTKATVSKPKETLDDYVCSDILKEELLDIKDFFENKDTYLKLHIEIPKGILFKGPPGTGKTYAARCIAGSVDCYFIQCTASALQGQYIGSGAQNIREVFKAAKSLQEVSKKDIIIFIDEIDSFGSRETNNGGASDEANRTVNQLLAEMSGFDDAPGIMVLAATNYASRLDDALMRSGRFSRQINIDYPDKIERLALIKYYFGKITMPLDDVEYEDIVALTEYFTPADIKELANESAILSVRKKLSKLNLDNINEAVNKNITKSIRNKDGDLDIHLVSAHEMGHVLAEILLRKTYPIKVTSYSYGGAGGFTQSGFKLRGIQDKKAYLDEVKILLGGRAAEQVVCGKITNGASSDLDKAKKVVKAFYEDYMFEKYEVKELDQIVLNVIQECYNDIVQLFVDNKTTLVELTKQLEKDRIMYTKDITPICMKFGLGGSIL